MTLVKFSLLVTRVINDTSFKKMANSCSAGAAWSVKVCFQLALRDLRNYSQAYADRHMPYLITIALPIWSWIWLENFLLLLPTTEEMSKRLLWAPACIISMYTSKQVSWLSHIPHPYMNHFIAHSRISPCTALAKSGSPAGVSVFWRVGLWCVLFSLYTGQLSWMRQLK